MTGLSVFNQAPQVGAGLMSSITGSGMPLAFGSGGGGTSGPIAGSVGTMSAPAFSPTVGSVNTNMGNVGQFFAGPGASPVGGPSPLGFGIYVRWAGRTSARTPRVPTIRRSPLAVSRRRCRRFRRCRRRLWFPRCARLLAALRCRIASRRCRRRSRACSRACCSRSSRCRRHRPIARSCNSKGKRTPRSSRMAAVTIRRSFPATTIRRALPPT